MACFLAKRDTPVAATLQFFFSGGISSVIITQIITKENIPRNYFVIILARMVVSGRGFLAKSLFWKLSWGVGSGGPIPPSKKCLGGLLSLYNDPFMRSVNSSVS